MFDASSRKQQLEDIREEQNHKLDPSLLMNQSSLATAFCNPNMMLRRRALQCQNSSSNNSTISLPRNSKFLPKEEIRERSYCSQQVRPIEQLELSASTDIGVAKKDSAQQNDKIFSITSSALLFITIVTLIGVLGLCICNQATLLVSAQYSNYGQQSQNSNNQQQQQQHSNQQIRSKMGRRGSDSEQPIFEQQPKLATKNFRESVHLESPNQAVSDERRSKQSSIDRFDSGEQIRPPLLRQPTTLAPLTTKSTAQQVSINKAFNLQTAASQDSYLSPEDREQLLKSQESHYEGKTGGSQEQPLDVEASASDRDSYENKPNRWSQPDHQNQHDLTDSKLNHLESRSGRPQTAPPGAANSDADDGDYEDEPPEPEKKRANLVPEIRRPTGSASYNHQRQYTNRPAIEAASEESDPSDDYGGANDDVHFSRKSNQADRSHLNPAASHNQQNHNIQSSYNPNSASSAYETGSRSNNEGPQDEGPGFGPGPNEAYMVDKAESVKPGLEHDDESSSLGPSESDSSGSNDEDNRFDRRSMNYPSRSSTNQQHSSQNNYGHQRPTASSVDNGEPEDSEEGPDSSEDSGPALAPSSKTEVKSRLHPVKFNQRLSNVVPKTSASALAPLSAVSPLGPPPAYSLPIPAVQTSRRASASGDQHQAPSPIQRQQVRPQIQPRFASQSNANINKADNHQSKASSVPYNPQNNPSHAGKYFIN